VKIKLDENLGERGAALFRRAGHDVATVPQEHLAGAGDRKLIDFCRRAAAWSRSTWISAIHSSSNPGNTPESRCCGFLRARWTQTYGKPAKYW
jgi:hypothetical protein